MSAGCREPGATLEPCAARCAHSAPGALVDEQRCAEANFSEDSFARNAAKSGAELAELEQRLFSVKAPLEERLRAYEERITELEKDLTAKGKENRELIEATIAIAKKKLELERSKERMGSN